MPFLPGLAVVFAGLLGGGHKPVDRAVAHQVQAIVHELHVKPVALAASKLRTLTHHGDGTKNLVRRLHASGVIGFEIVNGHGSPTLRLVIYDADGGLKTYTEVSLGAHGLSKDDLEVLRSNMEDDVSSLGGAAPAPAPAAPAARPAPDEIEMDPTPSAAPAPQAGARADQATDADPSDATAHGDAKPDTADASDAVSADEIAAMTSGNDSVDAQASSSGPSLHLGATVGFGIASRYFTPSPATVAAYAASPVGAVVAEAHVQPTARTTLSVSTLQTLNMTTPMSDGSIAATSIGLWEVGGSYSLVHRDRFELAAHVGFGHRAFSIDSTDPSRSPDGNYNYLIAGLEGALHLSSRLAVLGHASFDPVVSGSEPTEMAFGEATRWGVDVGGAVEYRPYAHLFARVAAQYQRFTWSWDMAGARGAGGAVDEYPSGSLSVGADY